MELIWFNWKTNVDYKEMLNKPEITTEIKIHKSDLKRILSHIRRNRKRRNQRKFNH